MEDRAILMAVYAEERTMARHFDTIRTGVATIIVTDMGADSATLFSTPDSLVHLIFASALSIFGLMMTAIFGLNHRLYFQRLKMAKKMLRHTVNRSQPTGDRAFDYDWLETVRRDATKQSEDESDRKKYRSLWWILTILVGVALPFLLLAKTLVDAQAADVFA